MQAVPPTELLEDLLSDPFAAANNGQLRPAERCMVFVVTLAVQPERVLEIGTFKGGGSTFFCAAALHCLGRGKITTVEVDPLLHEAARWRYEKHKPALYKYIEFLLGDSAEIVPELPPPDLVIMDGGDRYKDAVAVDSIAKPGCVLLFHDWKHYKERAGREYLLSHGWAVKGVTNEDDGTRSDLMMLVKQ